jgi:hypothetical protein
MASRDFCFLIDRVKVDVWKYSIIGVPPSNNELIACNGKFCSGFFTSFNAEHRASRNIRRITDDMLVTGHGLDLDRRRTDRRRALTAKYRYLGRHRTRTLKISSMDILRRRELGAAFVAVLRGIQITVPARPASDHFTVFLR